METNAAEDFTESDLNDKIMAPEQEEELERLEAEGIESAVDDVDEDPFEEERNNDIAADFNKDDASNNDN